VLKVAAVLGTRKFIFIPVSVPRTWHQEELEVITTFDFLTVERRESTTLVEEVVDVKEVTEKVVVADKLILAMEHIPRQ